VGIIVGIESIARARGVVAERAKQWRRGRRDDRRARPDGALSIHAGRVRGMCVCVYSVYVGMYMSVYAYSTVRTVRMRAMLWLRDASRPPVRLKARRGEASAVVRSAACPMRALALFPEVDFFLHRARAGVYGAVDDTADGVNAADDGGDVCEKGEEADAAFFVLDAEGR